MLKRTTAKLKTAFGAAFAVVGSVVGAGFITGREILTFFYGQSPFFIFILLFSLFSAAFYFILTANGENELAFLNGGDKVVCFLNLISVASMLGATEGLARDLGLGSDFPVWSVLMFAVSLFVCRRGVNGLARFNTVLVPTMLGAVFVFSVLAVARGNVGSVAFFRPFGLKIGTVISYVFMNVLLTQPLIDGIRAGEKIGRKSALLIAIFSSFLLAFTACVFLAVLPDESVFGDFPVLYISGSGVLARAVISVTVLFGIVTTLVGSLYPVVQTARKYGGKLFVVGVCSIAFAVSRLGFYSIVENVYPAVGVAATVYYAVFFCLKVVSRIKLKRAGNLKKVGRAHRSVRRAGV